MKLSDRYQSGKDFLEYINLALGLHRSNGNQNLIRHECTRITCVM